MRTWKRLRGVSSGDATDGRPTLASGYGSYAISTRALRLSRDREHNRRAGVRESYIVDREQEDQLLRDLICSSSICLTEEDMKDLQQEAPWLRLTEDGIEFSRGMVELMRYIWGKWDG